MLSSEIGRVFGVTGTTIRTTMQALGVPRRSPAENAQLVMLKRPPEQRKRNIRAAQDAVRGKPQPHDAKVKRAKTVQQRCKLSWHEQAVINGLEHHGVHPVPLFAVDKYNIDVAFPERSLGFEITSGAWHNTLKKRRMDEVKKRDLESLGWTIVNLNVQRTSPETIVEIIFDYLRVG